VPIEAVLPAAYTRAEDGGERTPKMAGGLKMADGQPTTGVAAQPKRMGGQPTTGVAAQSKRMDERKMREGEPQMTAAGPQKKRAL